MRTLISILQNYVGGFFRNKMWEMYKGVYKNQNAHNLNYYRTIFIFIAGKLNLTKLAKMPLRTHLKQSLNLSSYTRSLRKER